MSGTTNLELLDKALLEGDSETLKRLFDAHQEQLAIGVRHLKTRFSKIENYSTYIQAVWGFYEPGGLFSLRKLKHVMGSLEGRRGFGFVRSALNGAIQLHDQIVRSYVRYDPAQLAHLYPTIRHHGLTKAMPSGASETVSRAHFEEVVGQLVDNQHELMQQNAFLMKQMHELSTLMARSVTPASTSVSERTATPPGAV